MNQQQTSAARRRTRRRRPVANARFDHSVASPCVAVCAFDGARFCRGCYRTADEIRDWMILSRAEKLRILDNIKQRRQQATSCD